ncbi:hypothetical protein [Ferrovum myxofaciens]|jgi:hypothetical protein|uniref:hypothetical protein n=1 Tax=Ferrovum myxofaciens TaxID=416213 RepID=UPI0004E0D143|nr:hypothetical protein [Ferrovum myxofaciens]
MFFALISVLVLCVLALFLIFTYAMIMITLSAVAMVYIMSFLAFMSMFSSDNIGIALLLALITGTTINALLYRTFFGGE